MAVKEFKLPDLGEGLTEGEILRWFVQPGETVKLNQPIVEVETAKAAVEVPSPYAGIVTELLHAEGETVDVGTAIIRFEVDGAASGTVTESRAVLERTEATPSQPAPSDEEPKEERTSVLVGYGPRTSEPRRRPRKSAPPPQPAAPPKPPARVSAQAVGARAVAAAERGEVHALAKPPVRKLARDLGVDLRLVNGSGPDGVVTRDDVRAAASGPGVSIAAAAPVFDASREQRIPIRGVRKQMAAAMVASAYTAPHVTEFLTLDVTPTMDLVPKLAALPEFAEVRVSPLLLVARALIAAVRRHPLINSTWDDAEQEIVVKEYVNLGIAAATDRGLIVPNIKDAGRLSLAELAHGMQRLVEVARSGKSTPSDLTGGTITITNVGVFGVDTGTPIIPPGEAAILCFGAVRPMPWVHEAELAIRNVTTLSLSFDHRIVDGELGSKVIADIGRMLSDPAALLAWT